MTSDRPLRIAIFSDSALPILNGVSVSIDALVKELRERGHSVHLFTSAFHRYRDRDPNTHRFLAIETPWTRGYPLALPPFYPWLHEFRAHHFDVVHTHTPFTVGFVGLRWAQSHGLPVVSTYHTLYDKYTHYVPYFPKAFTRYKIAKHTNYYYNAVDHAITPSEFAKDWLVRHSIKTPVEVIPTGVPVPKPLDRATVRQELGISPSHKVLLYAGRIAREKNMERLLKAASLAMRQDPRVRFWIVGDGPSRGDCTRTVRELGIGDRVHFVGFVPRAKLDPYYAAADLFLFGSTTETQGLVVAEAMTYGLPTVIVRGGGASDAVVPGKTGFVVGDHPLEFAGALMRLLTEEDLYAEFSASAATVARSYTVPAMADRVLGVYRNVMGQTMVKEASRAQA